MEGRKQLAGIQDKEFHTDCTAEQKPRDLASVGVTKKIVARLSDVGAKAGKEMKLESEQVL